MVLRDSTTQFGNVLCTDDFKIKLFGKTHNTKVRWVPTCQQYVLGCIAASEFEQLDNTKRKVILNFIGILQDNVRVGIRQLNLSRHSVRQKDNDCKSQCKYTTELETTLWSDPRLVTSRTRCRVYICVTFCAVDSINSPYLTFPEQYLTPHLSHLSARF